MILKDHSSSYTESESWVFRKKTCSQHKSNERVFTSKTKHNLQKFKVWKFTSLWSQKRKGLMCVWGSMGYKRWSKIRLRHLSTASDGNISLYLPSPDLLLVSTCYSHTTRANLSNWKPCVSGLNQNRNGQMCLIRSAFDRIKNFHYREEKNFNLNNLLDIV